MRSSSRSSRRPSAPSAAAWWARGDRSEKIRTYNFPQNRMTDHRINFTLHQLDQIMEGRIDPLIDALTTHYNTEKLKQQNNGQ